MWFYNNENIKNSLENFKKQDEIKKWDLYKFNDSNNYWLDDYALFKALKDYFLTSLNELKSLTPAQRYEKKYEKIMNLGSFLER